MVRHLWLGLGQTPQGRRKVSTVPGLARLTMTMGTTQSNETNRVILTSSNLILFGDGADLHLCHSPQRRIGYQVSILNLHDVTKVDHMTKQFVLLFGEIGEVLW